MSCTYGKLTGIMLDFPNISNWLHRPSFLILSDIIVNFSIVEMGSAMP